MFGVYKKCEEDFEQVSVAEAEDDFTMEEETAKPSFWKRLKQIKLPAFGDPKQKKAASNIVRFLAVMLIATFIARGTSAATMPRVNVGSAQQTEIVNSISAGGTVTANGSIDFTAPSGLTIKKMLVDGGQEIEEGEAVAQFDTEEIQDQLSRAKVELKELQVRLNQLGQSSGTNSSTVAEAQRTYDWALADYNSAISQKNAAQVALDTAKANLANAEKALAELPPEATEEERAAAQAAVAEAQTAVAAAETALQTANGNETAAARELERAKQALEAAKASAAQAGQEAANTAANNAVEAEKIRLDIEEKNEQIAALQALLDTNGKLLAPQAGTVSQTAEQGSKTADGVAVASIIDTEGGYKAEAMVSENEAQGLNPGDKCQVAVNGSSYMYTPAVDGTVISVGKADQNGQCKVTIRLPQGEWQQGQGLQVNIEQSRKSYYLCVPLSAVHTDNSGSYVYRIYQKNTVLGVQNIVERVPVTVLDKDATNAAIEGPVSSTDKIVTDATKPLTEGDKVRILE